MRAWAINFVVLAFLEMPAGADPVDEKPREHSQPLAVEVIDSDGRAVEGADVGLCAAVGEWARKQADKDGTQWHYWLHARTDITGRANLKDDEKLLRGCAVLARHEKRKISGCIAVDAGAIQRSVRLILKPEIEITAELHCEALASRGIKYLPAGVAVDLGRPRVLVVSSDSGRLRFSLPPGAYQLQFDTYLHRAEMVKRLLTVSAHDGPLDLGRIELTAVKAELLVGMPAPEVPDVVAWKNGPGRTLADLRGQVVLLDFWGHWCGSCVAEMPKLFELHDKYHDRGLSILGIHVDHADDPSERVDSVAKLDKELADSRRALWANRDIPFPVAMIVRDSDKYGNTIAGVAQHAVDTTYGIAVYPTHVLIDRRGKVIRTFVGGISYHEDGMDVLEKALAAE
ncbi:MAG TPA: TlpA disulfide reductase family protein [Pirellulales bacterium]|jgi:thiol-disulfide isomerase/thioredoxin